MICTSCEGKNREGARFCTYCGETFSLRCPTCDNEIVPGGRFCDACGTPVGGTSDAPAVAARKVVTVLFSDLTGSTALEENMDAENVRTVLDRFYAAMRRETEAYGGRVIKFTGDGVMAAFGVPDVHEDDAARAIDAALAMREETEALARDLSLNLALKIGINTGEVVVSDKDEDVVGDCVNVASRLEGAAGPGEILVGEETWRLTRGTSRYERIEPLTLKGKSEPVPAYRLLAVDERTADSAAAPFVGREADLAGLVDVFEDAVRANAARLVTIIGSPGLGKTRLARELIVALEGRARARETRCDPAGAHTFEPIADLLRAAAGISETDTEDEVIAKLVARLPEDDPSRDRIAMRAAAILGVGLPGTTEETFWALRRLIEAAASAQPVVLVLDDLHWAEPLLLDLVEHLAEWIRHAPVLLVGTGRPELRDVRPSLAEPGRAATVIALEGLDSMSTAQLALNLLDTDVLPSELLAKIPVSTEGNPLFVRELVRMLVDDGVLVRTGEEWNVTVDVDAIQVPPTIQSLLAARVDRLRADERAVVELASVVGKEFYRGALCDLAPEHVRDQVDGCLESLRRKELVEPVGTYWIDEPVYRFHHVLIRDAAYRRVLKESRADLHERVAGWLELKTEDVLGEHDEVIGYHLEQAHDCRRQLGRADDVLGRRAADLLGAAARRALDRDDLPAAATLSARALDCLPADDPERPELLIVACEALLSMGDVVRGTPRVDELRSIATTERLKAWTTCFEEQTARVSLEETTRRVATAARTLADLGDFAGAAKAHTVRANTLARLGRFAECEAVLDDALNAARAANDRRRITATLALIPEAQVWGPNPVSRAGGRCLDMVRLLRITTGSPAVEAISHRCQAVLEAFRGRTDAARRMLGSARRTFTDLGLEHQVIRTDQSAGVVELIADDPSAAIPHLTAAYEGARKMGLDGAQSSVHLARAYLSLGQEDIAADYLGSNEYTRDDLSTAITSRSVRAELLARRGAYVEARRNAEDAVALAERTDALFDQGNACRSLARVLRAAGDADGARNADERAFALFERKGATALMDRASERSEERPQPASSSTLENACSRLCARWLDAFHAQDWDAIGALCADEIDAQDRRPGLRSQRVGRDTYVLAQQLTAPGTQIDITVLATRGERLDLERVWHHAKAGIDSPYEVWTLCINEIDEHGRLCTEIQFDPDDLDAAFAELDARYLAAEGAAFADTYRAAAELISCIDEDDYDGIRAIFVDGATVDDHTPASRGLMRVERFVESIQSLSRLSELRVRTTAVHAIADGLIVAEAHNEGTTEDDVAVDLAYHAVARVEDGRITRLDLFAAEHLDRALALFAELRSESPSLLENECARRYREFHERRERADTDGMAAMYAESLVVEDRRASLGDVVLGRDAALRQFDVLMFAKDIQVATEVLAIRGDRLALIDSRWQLNAPSYDVHLLSVAEIDHDGRFVRLVQFDPAQRTEAFDELEDRFIAGEGAPHAELVRLRQRLMRTFSAQDWDGLAEVLAPDAVVLDHRPASLGQITGAQYIETAKELGRLVPYRAEVVSYHRFGRDIAVCETRYDGTTPDGAVVESRFQFVFQVSGGRVVRMEPFPVDDLDAAIVRFEELSGPRQPARTNRAADVFLRQIELLARGDVDATVELIAEDQVYEDRRTGLRTVSRGREAAVEQTKAAMAVGIGASRIRTIATRGDRLALSSGTLMIVGTDGFEVEFLQLTEVDEDGRCTRAVTFDADALDAAIELLDERYAAGQSPESEVLLRLARHFIRGVYERDWDLFDDLISDDFTLVDHRLVGMGEIDRAGYVDALRTFGDLISLGKSVIVDLHAVSESGGVGEVLDTVRSGDGGDLEVSYHLLGLVRDGRIRRLEIFALDALEEALSRFAELTSTPEALENAATRFVGRLQDAIAIDDLTEFLALHADTFRLDDRRAALRNVTQGIDEIREYVKISRSAGLGRMEHLETIAIRGDRLCLTRRRYTPSEQGIDFETELLIVDEVDQEGRVVNAVFFDPDQIDAAIDELDARYVTAEGAAAAEMLHSVAEILRADNRRDYDLFRSLVVDDLCVTDHRPASTGSYTGGDEFIRNNFALSDAIADIRTRLASIDVAGSVALARLHASGTNSEGGAVVVDPWTVWKFDGPRLSAFEFFAVDDVEAARARFHELSARADARDNAAARVSRRITELFRARSWDDIAACFVPDVRVHDRRAGFRNEITGRDAFVENLRQFAAVGAAGWTDELIATRGDHLALFRRTLIGPAARDLELEILDLMETDEDGLITLGVHFEPTDIDAALKELDERYITSGDAADPDLVRWVSAFTRAHSARDVERVRTLYAQDVVGIDHRPTGAGTVDHEGLVSYTVAVYGLTEHATVRALRFVDLQPSRALVEFEMRGTTTEDGPYEIAGYWLLVRSGDRVGRIELFGLDQLDLARARYAADAGPRLAENAASRAMARQIDCLLRRDWAELASVFTPDSTYSDRRLGVGATFVGFEARLEDFKSVAGIGVTRIDASTIATRGARLSLSRLVFGDVARRHFEVEVLMLNEVGDDGRVASAVCFDATDIDAAFAELDHRYAEGEGHAFGAWIELDIAANRTYNERDWDAHRALLHDDFRLIDNRKAGGSIASSPDELIGAMRPIVDQAPDIKVYTSEHIRLSATHALSRVWSFGHSPHGGEIEIGSLALSEIRDGKLYGSENFDEGDLDRAIARFDELAAGRTSGIERATAALTDAFERRDWDAFRALHADDFVFADVRSGMSSSGTGTDAILQNWRELADVGFSTLRWTTLARRGDRLALFRSFAIHPDGYEVEVLALTDVDADLRFVFRATFDPSDVAAAFAELDERYLAGELAERPERDVVRGLRDYFDAYGRRDWDECTSLSSPNLVLVDHRPAGAGTIHGPHDLNRYLQIMIEQAPDVRIYLPHFVVLTPKTALARMWAVGTTTDGGPVEVIHYLVFVWDGVLTRVEIYPIERRDDALSRLDELTKALADGEPRGWPNACARVTTAINDAFAARDWARLAGHYSERVVLEDRRRGLGNRWVGREAQIEQMRVVADLGAHRYESKTIATRGDHLELSLSSVHGPPGQHDDYAPVDYLMLHELDAEGRVSAALLWDHDDIDAAFVELDERFIAPLGPDLADVVRLSLDLTAATNERSGQKLLSLLTEDFVLVDRRPASFGEVSGGEELLRIHFSQDAVSASRRADCVRLEAVAAHGSLCEVTVRGVSLDGVPFDTSRLLLLNIRDGRVSRAEYFPLDELDAARARFVELGDDRPRDTLANDCSRFMEIFIDAFERRDWRHIADSLASDSAFEDRRAGLGTRSEGKDAVLEMLNSLASVGAAEVDLSLLAVRGRRVALFRSVFGGSRSDPKRFEAECLELHEITEDGRLQRTILFDPDDFDAAHIELNERFAAGEGAPFADVICGPLAPFSAPGSESFLDVFDPSVVFVDHRPASAGVFHGPDAFLRFTNAWTGLVSTLREDVVAIHAIDQRGAVLESLIHGVNNDGGPIEIAVQYVALQHDGRLTRVEIFPVDQLDAALARFAELR